MTNLQLIAFVRYCQMFQEHDDIDTLEEAARYARLQAGAFCRELKLAPDETVEIFTVAAGPE